jgi:thymidylate synthase (FAD)
LARHRIASLTVKSTRYTLKELKNGYPFDEVDYDNLSVAEASKYIVLTDDSSVNYASYQALRQLQIILKSGVSNDKAKYCLPESYKTSLTWSINARSLINFLSLRSDKSALWEIRKLSNEIFKALPEEHKYLFEDCMKD